MQEGEAVRGAVEFLVWWAVLTGATVVMISTPGPVELLVAGTAAAGAALVAGRMRRAAGLRVSGGSGAPRAVAALPAAAVRGLAVLVTVLVRPGARPGRVRRIRLREGADRSWAGVVLGWSADTCVIDFPEGRDRVVVHTFADRPGGPERAVRRTQGRP
ncbi:hypothetical protein [Streptomyces sp. NPDC007369]|uniref:hypothetical protein n=1 Tax=Streptomyces sp. NPDC007369 TaxID=3154589 RepID=UPI0033EC129C